MEPRHLLTTLSIRSLRLTPKPLLFLPTRWSKSTVPWHSSPVRIPPFSNRFSKCKLNSKKLMESEEKSGVNSIGSNLKLRWLKNGRMRVVSWGRETISYKVTSLLSTVNTTSWPSSPTTLCTTSSSNFKTIKKFSSKSTLRDWIRLETKFNR